MNKYTCVIERVQNGEKIRCDFIDDFYEHGVLFLANITRVIAAAIYDHKLNKGNITEIKVSRFKDGSVFVSLLGTQDRIFAKVWRRENE